MLVKLYATDEISGRLFLQSCNLDIDAILTSEEKGTFYDCLFAMMHKISATKYHLKNYIKIEKQLFAQARNQFKKNPNQTREAFELIFELEGFLFQIKSSLDMLVKLLIPILGNNVVRTQTYGRKGESLIKGLDQLKNKRGVNVTAIDDLIQLIQQDKDCWLARIVDIRDKLNHVQGLRNYLFAPIRLPNGEIAVKKPKIVDIETVPFMHLIYSNNLEFHQDFMSVALSVRAPSGLLLVNVKPEDMKAKFNCETGEYVKFGWGLNVSVPEKIVQQNGDNS